jgi:hypothetical protein
MAISLKFFMIKRGLSFDKLVEMSGAKSTKDLVDYVSGLSVGVTASDEVDVQNYFASIAPSLDTAESASPENADVVVGQDDKPKRRRGKKTGDTDV